MYLLDANVLIEAERTYYSETIAPPFWQWLIKQHQKGNLASVHAVYQEITKAQKGYLKEHFSVDAPESFWIKETNPDGLAMQELSNWVQNRDNPRFRERAISDFLSAADYNLVAQAKTLGATVVTREQSEPRAVKRVLIPDACLAVGVDYASPFSMYETLGLKFS